MPRARRKALKILILLVASIITLKLCVTRRLESPSLRKVSLSESIVCGCPERLVVKAETTDNFISTCSQEATSRGPGQRVVSFSLYDLDNAKADSFITGMAENLRAMAKLYPGYIMRVYHNAKDDQLQKNGSLCRLFCSNLNVDLCNVRALESVGDISESFGMTWRFAPMADPLVSEWHSRDLDSVISEREAAAVADWRDNTNKSYHVMRDHPYHNTPILGGLFGMRVSKGKNMTHLKTIFKAMIDEARGEWTHGLDQVLLKKHLWPVSAPDSVVHDSFLCKSLPPIIFRPWPTQRKSSDNFSVPVIGNFVGSNGGSITLNSFGPCPVQCRPPDHIDWLLC